MLYVWYCIYMLLKVTTSVQLGRTCTYCTEPSQPWRLVFLGASSLCTSRISSKHYVTTAQHRSTLWHAVNCTTLLSSINWITKSNRPWTWLTRPPLHTHICQRACLCVLKLMRRPLLVSESCAVWCYSERDSNSPSAGGPNTPHQRQVETSEDDPVSGRWSQINPSISMKVLLCAGVVRRSQGYYSSLGDVRRTSSTSTQVQ